MKPTKFQKFYEAINYTFKNEAFLLEALTHKSYAHEHETSEFSIKHNERLEFLGDSILGLLVSQYLFSHADQFAEGQMTRFRALSVREETLAEAAHLIGLGDFLRLGKGEESSGGREKASNLSNAFEALIAAIHIDASINYKQQNEPDFFDETGCFFAKASHYTESETKRLNLHYEEDRKRAKQELSSFDLQNLSEPAKFLARVLWPFIWQAIDGEIVYDYKSSLLECIQVFDRQPNIAWDLQKVSGPSHAPEFTVAMKYNGNVLGLGTGTRKAQAEQNAAKQALAYLKKHNQNTLQNQK